MNGEKRDSNKKSRGKKGGRGEERKKKYSVGNMRDDIISGNAGAGKDNKGFHK